MKVDLKDIKKIVFLNFNVETGGPENINQTCRAIADLGIDASIMYTDKAQTHKERFQKYDNQIVTGIENNPSVLAVFPEGFDVDQYKNYNFKKALYWLSVNPVATSMKKTNLKEYLERNNILYNFYQCQYIHDYLSFCKIDNLVYIPDYIDDQFWLSPRKDYTRNKVVLYNPKKGYDFTSKLIENNKDLTFLPVQNLTRSQEIDLMDTSMMYIDFGNHPGKDRLPREAASRHLVVLTSRDGSAYNDVDVPIPKEFKFDANFSNLDNISKMIHFWLDNFKEAQALQNEYYNTVLAEKQTFLDYIKYAFTQDEEAVSNTNMVFS